MIPWSTIWTVLKDVSFWLLRMKQQSVILIVEDSPEEAELTAFKVKSIGWECDVVDSAEAALPLLLSRRHPVVLMDIRLPYMSGSRLAEKIHRVAPKIHIVFCIGEPADLHSIPRGVYFGIIAKPVTVDSLKDIFKKPKQIDA